MSDASKTDADVQAVRDGNNQSGPPSNNDAGFDGGRTKKAVRAAEGDQAALQARRQARRP